MASRPDMRSQTQQETPARAAPSASPDAPAEPTSAELEAVPVERPRYSFAERLAERRIRHLQRGYVYRIGFATAGFGVLTSGLLMLVLPGPGLLVTAIGLGMLALEFAWAERVLVRVVARLDKTKDQTRRLIRRGRH